MRMIMFFLAIGCGTSKVKSTVPEVVPQTEYKQTEGPTKTQGISKVEVLGTINLQTEFTTLTSPLQMRARRLSISETGVVAAHEHQSRPGIAFMLSGEMTEFRGGESFVRKPGDHSFEQTGVTHWWENRSGKTAQALVVDILLPADSDSKEAHKETFVWPDPPKENSGLSIEKTAEIDLSSENAAFQGKKLRMRVIGVSPSGVVANHLHTSRPGFAYVLSGVLTEYRNDGSEEAKHEPGSLVIESHGVRHHWQNETEEQAKVLVIDIY